MNSCIPMQRRKKRRKSSSSSGKWPRVEHADNDERGHDGHHGDDRTGDYDHNKDSESVSHDDIGKFTVPREEETVMNFLCF